MDRRLLTFFFGVAWLLFLGAVLAEHRPVEHQIIGGVTAVVLLGSWCLWLLRPGTPTALAFAAVGLASFLVANSPVSIGMQWMTLIVLLLSLSAGAALAYGAVIILVTAGVHLFTGSPWTLVLIEGGNAILLVAAGLAVAGLIRGRQRALDDLQTANARLRASLRDSRELALSQERERIAASLHDGLGHRLTTIGLSLDYSARMIERDPDKARAEILRAREATTDSLNVMRSTVRAMRPITLIDDHLTATLHQFAASFDTTGLQVTVDADLPQEPPPEQAQLILRFVQEALTNVVRHADADEVHITVHDHRVSLADNGRGNDAEPSFGLRTLQQAAAELGGRMDIDPHGGLTGGCRLTLTLPEAS
ncbi:MAG: sensor histidine kinase [Corynebacterium sp.]|uniref:sensor histidine kinase n=1 Tax=Corynebacterium sp. TaxID=1720 RepID=UPI0026DF4539|nr:sensor histidine kinase [Corynebacterium sp.]MDO5669643.1 sensor histidine kinase [Corynebacterium sp.]